MAINSILSRLPSESEAYDVAYENAMHRIQEETQTLNKKDIIMQVLLWI